jgi:anti-sigma B factor antagonist
VFAVEKRGESVYFLSGRLDASQVEAAEVMLGPVDGDASLNLTELEYISSAGLSLLLRLYKRLDDKGGSLKVVGVHRAIRNVFRYAGLEKVFSIE